MNKRKAKSKTHKTSPVAAASPHPRREWLLLALILLGTVAIRAAYFHELKNEPDFAKPVLDAQFHDYWARGIVSDNWTPPPGMPDPQIRTSPYGRPPAYPYFLALVYRLTDGSYAAARIVQMALGIANVLLAFALARALFSRAVGLLTAAFCAFYWGFIYYEGQLEAPVLEVLFVLLLLHAMRFFANAPSLLRAFAVGLVLGMFALVRSNVLIAFPVILVWMAWVFSRRQAQLVRFLASALLLTAGAALAVLPATVRNYRASGEFFTITYNGGVNLHIGNNPLTDCVMPVIPEIRQLAGVLTWTCFHYPEMMKGIAKKEHKDKISYAEANDYFKSKAWAYIRQHPGQTLQRIAKRALLFWGPTEISSNKVTQYDKANSLVLRYLPGFSIAFALALLGLGWLVYDLATRQHGVGETSGPASFLETIVGALLFGAAFFASFLPFLVSGRFRVPLMPILLMLAAYAIWRTVQSFRSTAYTQGTVSCVAGVVLIALTNIQIIPYQPERDYWHLQRGQSYDVAGRTDEAIAELKKAADLHGEFVGAMPQASLALIYMRRGDKENAIRYFKEGLAIDPNDPNTNNNIALLLTEEKRYDEAIPYFAKALRVDTRNPRIYSNLGFALAMAGKLEEAVTMCQEAIKFDPNFGPAYCNLAVALSLNREYLSAGPLYAKGVKLGSNEVKLPETLGEMLEKIGRNDLVVEWEDLSIEGNLDQGRDLVSKGRLDDAVERYQRVLNLDPANRDAFFNIGVIREAQGRWDEAAEALSMCVELEPGDAEAATHYAGVLARKGNTEEALKHYSIALENGGSAPTLHNSIGNLLGLQGRVDEALTHYDLALKENPKDKAAYYNRGRLLEMHGRDIEALESYKKAVENYPDNPKIHTSLGDLLLKQGKAEEAVKAYQKALGLNPGDQAAQKGLASAQQTQQSP